MRYSLVLTVTCISTAFLFACKKSNTDSNCFPNSTTVRQITNAQATVKKSGDKFYIIEQGAIDTKLNPCPLPEEFQIDNLVVTVSGDVKATIQGGPGPCCTDNFLVTKISK